jgi:hypothetical protein
MFLKIILFLIFTSLSIAYSLCKVAGDSDKLVEEMMLKNPPDFGFCSNKCFECKISQHCRVYSVIREA